MKEEAKSRKIIEVKGLTVGFGHTTVLEDASFSVMEGDVFAILGPSGCGKTTLLNVLIGLLMPWKGKIILADEEIGTEEGRQDALFRVRQQTGVLFQSGALLDWMTIGENIAFPLRQFTDLPDEIIEQIVQIKLGLVKLDKAANMMPSELSGGMIRRAGLATATALDPRILFCDEPSSGLDPLMAMEIDELLIQFNKYLKATLVVVTHEVETLENIATQCIMLDKEAKGIIAAGTLEELKNKDDERVRAFFRRRTGKQFREKMNQ